MMDICYHFKGGVTRLDALMMSPRERLNHIKYISDMLKQKAKAMTGQEYM